MHSSVSKWQAHIKLGTEKTAERTQTSKQIVKLVRAPFYSLELSITGKLPLILPEFSPQVWDKRLQSGINIQDWAPA